MRAAFGLEVSERHFAWKYVENPSGPAVGFEATPQMCDHAFGAVAGFLFEQTGASVLYTWEPVDDARRPALRRSGFVKNPVRKGPGSARYSLVARSEPRLVHGQDWLDPTNFDVQPIMHD